jgi:exopolysaccharide transport family protein
MNALSSARDLNTASAPAVVTPLVEGRLDLGQILSVARRRWRPFLTVAGVVMMVAGLITLDATPKYTATAKVMLDPRKETVTNVQDVLSGLPPQSEVVDTEVEVIKSSQLAGRVVDSLHLEQDPEFNSALRHSPRVRDARKRSPPVKLAPIDAQKQREVIVHRVMTGLTVKRMGLTYVMDVSYRSSSPIKAAEIANKFAELYLLEQLETKFNATRQATFWLNSRLAELRSQVEDADAAVQQYKIRNDLLSAAGTNLTEQEISAYNQSLAQAQTQLAEDTARLNTARGQLAKGSAGDDLGEALDSPVIQRLREQRAELSAKVADLQSRYGDRHPDLLKARRQLEDIDGQIQAEIQRIISNLAAKAEVARQRVVAIHGSIGATRDRLADNNRAMVRLNELQRAADASRALYENYLNRFKETSNQQGVGQPDARILAPADVPLAPSSPMVGLNLGLGLLLALCAGAGAVALAEHLDAGLTTADEAERRLGVSCLGIIPLLASVADDSEINPPAHVVRTPLGAFSEAFRHLRTSIQYCRPGEPVQVVAITSALPGEGKTTTAICLGRAAALQGAKVLVIDCDLRRRKIHELFQVEPGVGLLQVLNGEATLQVAVAVDAASGAHFLPLTKGARTPQDVFGSIAMHSLLVAARKQYDLIILDTPPTVPVADTRVLAPKADAILFVARWRKTAAQTVRLALRQLDGSGAHIGGVVLTQVDMKQQARLGYDGPRSQYYEYYEEAAE